ncbi:hypothetical protein AQJ46_11995 [Streptomyces canus]|uniref:Ricin B lectin domain-containing protein n=1 Tax=Streptomyces canus TaxID=58343 RepID=A0A101SE14_9ACTN|nr:hypothetical protein AQJ46_11995 [Streptomyces canus]
MDCNAGGNQSWDWDTDKQLTVHGNTCMTVGGTGATAGDPVVITDCTGAAAQQWSVNADLSMTSVANRGTLPGRGRSGHRQRHGGRWLVLQRRQQPAGDQELTPAPVASAIDSEH